MSNDEIKKKINFIKKTLRKKIELTWVNSINPLLGYKIRINSQKKVKQITKLKAQYSNVKS